MWQNRLEWLMGLAVLVLAALLANRAFLAAGTSHVEEGVQTVVIDPGHGGVDPGKIGVNDVLEKDVNLQISLYLKELLEEAGVSVVMTRDEDEGLYSENASNKKKEDMQARCALIAETDPVIAVSIHQNSYHEGGVSGCQVFYYEGSKEGERLALEIQDSMTQKLSPSSERQAKSNDSYYMLRHTVVPTVIVECGFLSNWAEAQKLSTEDYQRQVAEAVADGILQYLEEI